MIRVHAKYEYVESHAKTISDYAQKRRQEVVCEGIRDLSHAQSCHVACLIAAVLLGRG
jgi:hypothetical protein